MENQDTGGLGGRNRKGKDKDDDKKKDKKNELPLRENEKPRNRKYTEEEKGKKVKVPSWDDGLPFEWYWGNYQGIVSNVLNQKHEAICWAITRIRAIEALLNIGLECESQRSLSIQHLRNNVDYGADGLLIDEHADNYIRDHGLLDEAECSYSRSKTTCQHDQNVERTMIDNIVHHRDVDDMMLLEMVRRQPVIGILPLSNALIGHKHGIFKYSKNTMDVDKIKKHAVLIVGFDIDKNENAYWIIQNSWGEEWGTEGFAYVYRNTKRGQGSMFLRVSVPVKKDYPKEEKKKKKK